MAKTIRNYYCVLLLTVIAVSCTKEATNLPNGTGGSQQHLEQSRVSTASSLSASSPCSTCGIIDNMPSAMYEQDSIERPTVLGRQRTNPYTLDNMRTAYNNLGLSNINVSATHVYVRFQPKSGEQLAFLDSILNKQNLDLFDAPMDYDIQQEGDYYQDPAISTDQVTYQYAVVPTSFVFPASITFKILSQVHIPDDAYTAVETEAERLAGIKDANNSFGIIARNVAPFDPDYGGGGSGSGEYPPAPDAATAAGYIRVEDVNTATRPGVRNVMVVAKRWFKVERMYTNNDGYFRSTKKFKHKTKLVVKFTNDYVNIRAMRGVRLWQMYYPVSKTLGVYDGNKNTVDYCFYRFTEGSKFAAAKANRYWAAATVNNAVFEQRDYASWMQFNAPPKNLQILLTSTGSGGGAAPLFKIRSEKQGINNDFITLFLGNPGSVTALNMPNTDIILSYNKTLDHFTSDYIKEMAYHELSHASMYTKVGMGWYNEFVAAEVLEMHDHIGNPNYSPYGDGQKANVSPIIALGEAWAYHMGYWLAHQKYNVETTPTKGSNFSIQGDPWGYALAGDALEGFNPKYTSDKFYWIPQGLMLDLMDNTSSETRVNDNVSGFSVQQIFNAFQGDVKSVPGFKAKLLQLNGTVQQTQINELFTSYGY